MMRANQHPAGKFARRCSSVLLGFGLALSAGMSAGAATPPLPVACAAGSCGANATQFVTVGTANAVSTGNTMTINQATKQAVLNWSSFNIAAGNTVKFVQPDKNSVALNRIFQNSPSQIFGNLSANGQVYLLNLNGFLFGATSKTNVGGLLVSTLPMTLKDTDFASGILSPLQNDKPLFDATCDGCDPLAPGGRMSVLDANGNPVLGANGKPLAVQIVVAPGAQMQAASQGRLMLTGQSVVNGGSLDAPDGQVLLAAGQKVYVQASTDSNLRGLLVEVEANPDNVAWNQLTGSLSAARGNVSMVGLAVNQDGRISATTSVSANGSVRLEAAAGPPQFGEAAGGKVTVSSTQGGALTIGSHSDISILPEVDSDATAVATESQPHSTITMLGRQIVMKGGSIKAPGGDLTVLAAPNPAAALAPRTSGGTTLTGVGSGSDPDSRLRIDAGTNIDLSGSIVSLPVTVNLVAAQLRSSELADDPNQRNGLLRGQTVYVDARQGGKLPIANVQGDIDIVPQNIAQRTETGGNAVFQSQGDIVFSKGASLNVSGGHTDYSGGFMQTSYLVGADGKLYPIATADPLRTYVGVLNPTFTQTYNRWGVKEVIATPGLSAYQPGYIQGASAGSVQFAAPSMVLAGQLTGKAVNGPYQRTSDTIVSGGRLTIGMPIGAFEPQFIDFQPIDYIAPAVRFTNSASPIVVADDAPLPANLPLDLSTSYLTDSGFTSTQIASNYGVTLPAATPLVLAPGSKLQVSAAWVDVLSNIIDAGGSLAFQNFFTPGSIAVASHRSGVFVGDGVTLDVRGMLTNDQLTSRAGELATGELYKDAGSISLATTTPGSMLAIGDDVSLLASGGAWIKPSGSIVGGKGGSISLVTAGIDDGIAFGNRLAIEGFGVNGATGGTFALTAPRLAIGAAGSNWISPQQVDDTATPGGVLHVAANLFSDYGFQNFALNAAGLVTKNASNSTLLSLDPGVTVNATVSSLVLHDNVTLLPGAKSITGLADVTQLAPYLRPGASISLSAIPPSYVYTPLTPTNDLANGTRAGDVVIGRGSSITTDAGGSIALSSWDSIVVDGKLTAPGGKVAMQLPTPAIFTFNTPFLPTQRIELGSSGAIDVAGRFIGRPSEQYADLGTLYGGGSVQLFADRGAVVTDAGSSISVAGANHALDVVQSNGTVGHEMAASAGGSIAVHSGEAISLLGDIDAKAGVAGDSGTAAAGSLSVALTRSQSWWGVNDPAILDSFNKAPLAIDVVAGAMGESTFDSNRVELGADALRKSGIDALRLESDGSVQFGSSTNASPVVLSLGRQLVIDAPVIASNSGTRVDASAPFLQVGYSTLPYVNAAQPLGGSGQLNFSGDEIDLVGHTVLQGANSTRFTSSGDLLLRGVPTGTESDALRLLNGSLKSGGSLTLNASRIFPATATSFVIQAPTVTIGQTNASVGTPLSAAGNLTINADNLTTNGSLYAPFGTISLNATQSLTLGDSSLTSVSGDGLTIPFGQTTLGGRQWVYGLGTPPPINGVPDRAVHLKSPAISMAKNATIDLRGGGDLLAYEFVPGAGGTIDRLDGSQPGLYAIVPSMRGQASPQDPQETSNPGLQSGQSVYLSGGAGLAAGFYPLLPARFALLPGAYLIQVQPNSQSTTPGSMGTLRDGTPVVAGYLSYGSTGLHQSPGYSGIAVYPGTYAYKLDEFDTHLASTFFSNAAAAAGAPRPTLPGDAGRFSVTVPQPADPAIANILDLFGNVKTGAARGGIGATIEFSANDLVVGTANGATSPADPVHIDASVLNGWHPGSLLLGGTTSTPGAIDVSARSVTVGSGPALVADEIALVANQSIDVQAGGALETNSAVSDAALKTLPLAKSVTLSGTPGSAPALLAVSDLNWLTPVRPAGAQSTDAATINIAAGGSIASRGSLSIDGQGGIGISGETRGPGAEWLLGSSSIGFVGSSAPAGASADRFLINPGVLSQLDGAGAVRIASTGSIDLYTPVNLGVDGKGTVTLQSLTIQGASLNNLAGSGTTQLGAHELTLEGVSSGQSLATAGTDASSLRMVADTLELGPGSISVNGFAGTRAQVNGAVTGRGVGGLALGGVAEINSAGLTAAPGASTSISSTGQLTIAKAASSSAATFKPELGGELNLKGSAVDISGSVAASSGNVNIAAAAGDVVLESGASISVAGRTVSIQSQSAGTAGGNVSILAAGRLDLKSGSLVDVSGAGDRSGGSLRLGAGGAAAVNALLKGGGTQGGAFQLDAGSLLATPVTADALTALSDTLAAGAFTRQIDLRVRAGDLNLVAGKSLTANEVTLAADTGQVIVGGSVSTPSGALRGSLSLFGDAGVTVTGALHADGGSSSRAGQITIGAGDSGYGIRLAGSTLTASGSGEMGTLLLRAPALIGAGDVAIESLPSSLTAVGRVILEPLMHFNTSSMSSATAPRAADLQLVQQAVDGYMAAATPTIGTRLNTGTTPSLIEAGVEIDAPGALTLQDPLDLSTWRFNGAPVDFIVRAAGDLAVNGSISDGFSDQLVGSTLQPTLVGGPSGSIRLIAGADLASANPLSVVTGGTGDLSLGTLSAPAVVRTGSGDIDLVAARNIIVGSAGSGAYTAGSPADITPDIPAAAGTIAQSSPDASGNSYSLGLQVARSTLLMSFPVGGGGLHVQAGQDVQGAALPTPSAGGWLLREGGGNKAILPVWGVNFADYNWNFGTLGGGDLRIDAGRDVNIVTAAAAGSLVPQYGGQTQFIRSGGLSIMAGRNLGSSEVLLSDGAGRVNAGGALSAVLPPVAGNLGDPNVGSAFYLQSAALDINSRNGMAVDGVYNPTVLFQPRASSSRALVGSYLSYSETSSIQLNATAGDVSFGASDASVATLLGTSVDGLGTGVFPSSFAARALSGGISFGPGFGAGGVAALNPSANGQLELLAAHDIEGNSLGKLIMSDAAPGSYANVATPAAPIPIGSPIAAFNGNLHANDTMPALVTAGGDIRDLTLSIPKAAHVDAGHDMVEVNYQGQNANSDSQTILTAGRDLVFTTAGPSISVGGPGSVDVLAGRNVSLGFSRDGLVTVGNLRNPNLPTAQGANITVATGLGTAPDIARFLSKVVAPSKNYQDELIAFMQERSGGGALAFADALAAFKKLPPVEQRPLVDQIFFNELSVSGIAANTGLGVGFEQGYAAIDALYHGSRTAGPDFDATAFAGNLSLAFSRIYTLSGGDINLIVPGGNIDVGLANPPKSLLGDNRPASTLGIVAQGPGDVNIYSRGDVNVNASRIFTLGGGNILIWSNEGNIDAGRGAKTAVSAPPPTVLINSDGTVSVSFAGAAAGSGIRTIQTDPSFALGSVDLIAPQGTVNAGDAGIGAAGNINIAAQSVIGLDNIQFGGTSTGVPSSVSDVGASLSGASAASSGTSNAATGSANGEGDRQSAAPIAQDALSWLEVFVTGLGEDNCRPDDLECLKRQAPAKH